MTGQINRGSPVGELIYNLSLDENNLIFLETGTWNGEGSTKCFMDGLLQRNDDSILYSLESYGFHYDEAKAYWDPIMSVYVKKKLSLIRGRIIEPSEVMTIEEVENCSKPPDHPDWRKWHRGNMKGYNECLNVYDQLPDHIDVFLLDGGEFSSYAEYKKMKDSTKILLLDDSNELKNRQARKELLSSENWSVLVDWPHYRNGFAAFKRNDMINE
jgi:hypothetical protein